MIECEVIRQGILYFVAEKGSSKSINEEYYDNVDDAYRNACRFLRNEGVSFILTIPAEIYEY